jgi:hypothetical protein
MKNKLIDLFQDVTVFIAWSLILGTVAFTLVYSPFIILALCK